MEAPEKIYIPTILVANTVRYKEEGSIEYIRADVLDDIIIKSSVWFANRYQANGSYLCATDVEDYRKEIKEYIKQKWL